MEINSVNPKLGQDRIAKELGCSNSTLQRFRQDINMLSPHGISSNTHKRRQKTSNQDLKRPSMTSKDLL